MNVFYVYIHRRCDTNEVFYVGKGKNRRAYEKDGRNRHWLNIVSKHDRTVEIVESELSEQSAFDLEIELIKFYRDNGHKLVNITDGGEGASGVKRTDKEKKHLSVVGKTSVKPFSNPTFDGKLRLPKMLRIRLANVPFTHKKTFFMIIANLLKGGKYTFYSNRNGYLVSKSHSNYSVNKVINWLNSIGVINLYKGSYAPVKSGDYSYVERLLPEELFLSIIENA